MKNLKVMKNMLWDKKHPVSLIQFVTNRCNARCSFCFIDFDDKEQQNRKNEMTVEDFDKLTKKLGPSLMHVNLTGGEPFLRPDLAEIAKCYFRNAGLDSILINTNGSMPNMIQKFIDEIFDKFPDKKLYFIFSIDSFPEEHNKIRKIPNLFAKLIESYNIVKSYAPRATSSVNLTVSLENYKDVNNLYETLKNEYDVQVFNPVIVRDEGVYKTPLDLKKEILNAYTELANKIVEDVRKKNISGFNKGNIQGILLNAKSSIQYKEIAKNYLTPEYKSLCPAGSIFGVIFADGSVHPCEILKKPLGNIKDYDYDFLKLWNDTKAKEAKEWIKESKCHCHWECAWTYNILSNPQYHFELIKNSIGYLA